MFKSRIPNDIIEIGAVKLGDGLEYLGTFQEFVKPKVFRKLFSTIRRKTGIVQRDVDNAANFKEVLGRFHEWLGKEYILCCWGHDDIHHLKVNCEFNLRGIKWLKPHIDIQNQFSRLYQLPVGQRHSLKNALNLLETPLEEDLYRADTDARYTAEIFIRVFDRLDMRVY